ncbi:MAG: hypothetical protein NVS1B4_26820 [Gemmatimonadaceae bacterium]
MAGGLAARECNARRTRLYDRVHSAVPGRLARMRRVSVRAANVFKRWRSGRVTGYPARRPYAAMIAGVSGAILTVMR